MKIFCLLICANFLTPIAHASTAFDQILGIRISQLIAREIMGSPPLPSLDEASRTHFSPRISYLVADANNLDESDTEYSALFKGKLKGWSTGAALTRSSKSNLSYYAFGTFTSVSGEISVVNRNDHLPTDPSLKDMKNMGTNLSAGLSYRLWSKKTFPFVIGVMGGPFISYFRSTFNYVDNRINEKNNYESNSFIFGPSFGVQGILEVFRIQLNPFFLSYIDLSSPCQTYKTNAKQNIVSPDSAKSCSVENREIYMKGSFYSYGLNVGVLGLSIGAFTKIQKDSSLSSIEVKNYNAAYTFHF